MFFICAMPKKLTHEACRAKVCAICYGRSGNKANQKVTAHLELGMRSFVFPEYNMSDERFPAGLCDTCRLTLLEQMKGESLRDGKPIRELVLPDPTCYQAKPSKVTRLSSSQDCQCLICSLARMNGLEWRRFVADCKKGKVEAPPDIKYDRLCRDCFAPIYRGSNHTSSSCKSRKQTLSNLDSLAEVIPSQFSLFFATLTSFRDVISSCFGFVLDPYFKNVLARFRDNFQLLSSNFGVSITNKIHIISIHVQQFCELTGKGLGEYSEQETENAHTVFDDTWTRYKVKDCSSSFYHKQYFKATMDFNSNNV